MLLRMANVLDHIAYWLSSQACMEAQDGEITQADDDYAAYEANVFHGPKDRGIPMKLLEYCERFFGWRLLLFILGLLMGMILPRLPPW